MIFSQFASSDVDECSADVNIFTRSGKECVGKDIMYRLHLKLLILFVWDTQEASC